MPYNDNNEKRIENFLIAFEGYLIGPEEILQDETILHSFINPITKEVVELRGDFLEFSVAHLVKKEKITDKNISTPNIIGKGDETYCTITDTATEKEYVLTKKGFVELAGMWPSFCQNCYTPEEMRVTKVLVDLPVKKEKAPNKGFIANPHPSKNCLTFVNPITEETKGVREDFLNFIVKHLVKKEEFENKQISIPNIIGEGDEAYCIITDTDTKKEYVLTKNGLDQFRDLWEFLVEHFYREEISTIPVQKEKAPNDKEKGTRKNALTKDIIDEYEEIIYMDVASGKEFEYLEDWRAFLTDEFMCAVKRGEK